MLTVQSVHYTLQAVITIEDAAPKVGLKAFQSGGLTVSRPATHDVRRPAYLIHPNARACDVPAHGCGALTIDTKGSQLVAITGLQ